MTRTVLNLDDDLLARASEIFGTKTKVATVNAALADVVSRAGQLEFIDWLASGALPDLGNPEVMDKAWH